MVHLIVSRTASGSSVRFAAAFAAMHILWSRQGPKAGRVGTPVTSPSAKRPRLTSPSGEIKTPTAADMKPALIECAPSPLSSLMPGPLALRGSGT